MGLPGLSGLGGLSGVMGQNAATYHQKVLAIEPANLILYLAQSETAGVTAFDQSSQGNNGTYTGVDLANAAGPVGDLVPFYDGANDYLNEYSAGFIADFNGAECTILTWARVNGAATWTDGASRRMFTFKANANNLITAFKRSNPNQVAMVYTAGGVEKAYYSIAYSSAAWFPLVMTMSATGDEVKYYLDGAPAAATLNGLGAWAGVPAMVDCVIGSQDTGPAQVWHGWLGPVAMWTKALTPAQVLEISTP